MFENVNVLFTKVKYKFCFFKLQFVMWWLTRQEYQDYRQTNLQFPVLHLLFLLDDIQEEECVLHGASTDPLHRLIHNNLINVIKILFKAEAPLMAIKWLRGFSIVVGGGMSLSSNRKVLPWCPASGGCCWRGSRVSCHGPPCICSSCLSAMQYSLVRKW